MSEFSLNMWIIFTDSDCLCTKQQTKFVYELEYSINWPILGIAHYMNRPFMRIGIYVYEILRISICMCIGLYQFTRHRNMI